MDQSPGRRIEKCRKELGSRLTILGHHYQSDEVIGHVDIRGDSLELARKVCEITSEYIVFCGVYFMAESAALLSRPGQSVHLPDHTAECGMALMAEAPVAENVLRKLTANGRRLTPLAYVNSTLGVKGVVGAWGGSVCTSANARTMLAWAFEQGGDVLFLPDENLGWNTADLMGISELERKVLSIVGDGERFDPAGTEKARLLLWPGYCYVHTFFTMEHVNKARTAHPGARIVVHPESRPEVVAAVDAAGSTSFIIDYVEQARPGETIIIGTEMNLVSRLARQQAGRGTVLPLAESTCTHMAQITEARLADCLEALCRGEDTFQVRAPEKYAANAKLALDRMMQHV